MWQSHAQALSLCAAAPHQVAEHCRSTLTPSQPPSQDYVRVFEPLLLEECAAQMLRGQEEGQVLTSQASGRGGQWAAGQARGLADGSWQLLHAAASACSRAPRAVDSGPGSSVRWQRAAAASCCIALPHATPSPLLRTTRSPCCCGSLQPAVVAATQARQSGDDESQLVRLTLPPGVSSTFHDNDMLLLSRDNPEVGGWLGGQVGGWLAGSRRAVGRLMCVGRRAARGS